MGTIIVKTSEETDKDSGAYIHIPEELWELSKKHRVYVEDYTGEKVLVIDLTRPNLTRPTQSPTLRGKI